MKLGRYIAMAALLFVAINPVKADDYKFKIHNNTDKAIKKVLVSEDGEKYGFFDIGKGIPAGATATLVWDKSTDDEACEQYFKAVFDGGDESEPVQFDFCESDVALEFE